MSERNIDMDISSRLSSAVQCGRIAETRELIDAYGLSYSPDWSKGYTLLVQALKNGHSDIAKLLLTSGSRVNDKNENRSDTPLHLAVEKNYTEIVEMLLEKDANIEAKNRIFNGDTPLHLAVEKNYTEIVEMLLEKGANIEAKDKYFETPLYSAVNNGNIALTKLLLNHGADVNASNNYDKSLCEDVQMLQMFKFWKYPPSVNVKFLLIDSYRKGYTPLHMAAHRAGSIEIARILLNNGGNVHAENNDGFTPLCIAIQDGNTEFVELLLEYGANVHAEDNDGFTLLHIAMKYGHTECVELLLEYGANVDSKGGTHMTPLHLCAMAGHNTSTKTILKFGADINSRDKEDKTPLHKACQNGHGEVVNLLLEYGFDINIITKELNNTPLNYALNIQLYGGFDVFSAIDSIVKAMTHHIIKMKTANLHVSDENLRSTSDSEFDDFRNECKKEIVLMKSEKINANISFYDILAKGPSSLEMYMRNENVVQALKSGNYETKFPIYATMIKHNFRKSMERNMLLELSKRELHSLFTNYPLLPYICMEKILSFLDEKDLKTLINLCPSNYYVAYCSFIKKHNYLFL